MVFPYLPPEILEHLLIHAVIARGIKRALRLRLVSRCWSRQILHLIFTTGLPDDASWLGRLDRPDGSAQLFWQRYLAWRITYAVRGELDPPGPSLSGGPRPERPQDWGFRHLVAPPATRRLRTMRRVAEHIVQWSPNNLDLDTVIFRLSRLPLMEISSFNTHFRDTFFAEFTVDEAVRSKHEAEEETTMAFRCSMLSAAAYLDEFEIVQNLMQSVSSATISSYQQTCPFGSPVDAAAYGGSRRCVALLMLLPQKLGWNMYKARSRAIQCAGRCINPQGAREVLDLGINPNDAGFADLVAITANEPGIVDDPATGWMRMKLLDCMRETSDVEVYKRCYEIVGHVVLPPNADPGRGLTRESWMFCEWFPSQLEAAARRGCVEIVQFLFDRYQLEVGPAKAFNDEELAEDKSNFYYSHKNREIPDSLPLDAQLDSSDSLCVFHSPVSVAALDGHHDAVDFFLRHGVTKPHRALVASAASGSRRLVKTVLDHFAATADSPSIDIAAIHGNLSVQDALTMAIFREDEAMVHLLLHHGAEFDSTTWEALFKETSSWGLQTMNELLLAIGKPEKGAETLESAAATSRPAVRRRPVSLLRAIPDVAFCKQTREPDPEPDSPPSYSSIDL